MAESEKSSESPGSKKRRGRPRHGNHVPDGDPGEEILRAAASLFAAHGYGGTSTRMIAEACGLRQPSIFHYFKKKDAILEALLVRMVSPYLYFLDELDASPSGPPVRLYRLVRFHLYQLTESPFETTALGLVPELKSARFERFFESRARLVEAFEKIIRKGVAEGDFVPCVPWLVTRALFGMNEASSSWFKPEGDFTPDDVTDELCDLALRGLLSDPTSLESVRAQADREDGIEYEET